jgi:hypothetical protein
VSKELSRLADPDELDLDDCVPAYLILYDKKAKMYRCYHADVSDVVVLDEDPLKGMESLLNILEQEVNHETDTNYN